MSVFLLFFLFADGFLNPKEGIVLAPVPEELELYLELPASMSIDKDGRIYVLDVGAETVFVWNKDGSFHKNFGRSGRGPGEFHFQPEYRSSVHSVIVNDRYIVYDGQSFTLHYFRLDGTFDKAVPFSIANGTPDSFYATSQGDFVILNTMSSVQNPYSEALIFGSDLEKKKTLLKRADNLFSAIFKDEKFAGYKYQPFAPRTAIFSDPFHENIIVGANERTEFYLFNSKGRKTSTIRYKAPAIPVSEKEREAAVDLDWLKKVSAKVVFADYFPHYTVIYPVKDKGYLVVRLLWADLKIDCILIDKRGKTLGRYIQNLGDEGAIYSCAGRMFLQLDEGEKFTFKEIIF